MGTSSDPSAEHPYFCTVPKEESVLVNSFLDSLSMSHLDFDDTSTADSNVGPMVCGPPPPKERVPPPQWCR